MEVMVDAQGIFVSDDENTGRLLLIQHPDPTSSCNASVVSSPMEPPTAGEKSEDTPASSVSQANDLHSADIKFAREEPQTAKKKTDVPENAERDEQPTTTDKDGKEEKKHEIPSPPDSDSENDSDDDYVPFSLRRVMSGINSQQVFNALKYRMKHKAERKKRTSQAPNLVEGLVDYLRVVEERINHLEAKSGVMTDKEDKMKAAAFHRSDGGDSTVEVAVKFFNAASYLEPDGSYPAVDNETEEGTFMCSHDTQHLIRVLYSAVRNDGATVQKHADAEPPNVADIDILTFGVSSESIATFFAKQMDMDAEDDHLIKFGKPFRPLFRNLDRVRAQLEKLESSYG
jgi:hypothetical protein